MKESNPQSGHPELLRAPRFQPKEEAKRKLLLLLPALLPTGSTGIFAGGVPEQPAAATPKADPAGTKYPIPMELPLVKTPVTLTYFCDIDAKKIGVHTQDYNDLLQFKLYEKMTGVHIDFKHPPAGQTNEQFNLLIASAQRPDMMFRGGWPQLPDGPRSSSKRACSWT